MAILSSEAGDCPSTLPAAADHPLTTPAGARAGPAVTWPAMEFGLLGPFQARHDGAPVQVSRRRQERLLLGVLLLEAGRAVPVGRLADLVWDGAGPPSPRAVIQTYVGRLRAALRPYGVDVAAAGDGYAVPSAGVRVDAAEFAALADRAAAADDPATRSRLCDAALARWRGPLLADLADDGLRDRLGTGLAERRMSVVELRARTLLELGAPDRVVADLTPLAGAHPGRERLVEALMLALYRCGRQVDALRAYEATASAAADALGVRPGADLRALRDRIVRCDPRLDRLAAPVYAVRVRDQWLPWAVGGHPALELCNTYAGWGGPRAPGAEWLRGYPTLAAWAGHAGLVDESTVTWLLRRARAQPLAAGEVLGEVRALRAALYACLTRPADEAAFRAVARVAEEAAGASAFVREADGLGRWRVSRAAGLRLPLLAAAHAGAALLADPRRHAVRRCASARCGWLFLDEEGRRRWCSLATCGPDQRPDRCAANSGARTSGQSLG
jgi:DNA-binding SARP family transcriptional activator/predicted RNA-binding Zn ribbon-like protein